MEQSLFPSQVHAASGSPRAPKTLKETSILTLAALGVVFGDIGTSPLYALQEIFFGRSETLLTETDVIGTLSLVVWSLILVISVKYLTIVLRADNDGEGGIFSLYSRIHPFKDRFAVILKILIMLGAGLLFGEGMITPAISVLSAVEGAKGIVPEVQSYLLPIVSLILIVLFSMQKFGSSRVGKFFGPMACVWFVMIAVIGAINISEAPRILWAFNPFNALWSLYSAGQGLALARLGALILVITGGEALFADMGHFGASAIRLGWYFIVFPALILNYLGQGAYLLSHGLVMPANGLFFALIHPGFLPVAVVVATFAAVIASQALISGVFALSSQAVALGIFPRLKVVHTHHEHSGQTFVPIVNFMIFCGSMTLVWGFKSSSALAGAYGFALSCVMLVTTLVMIMVASRYWHWSFSKLALVLGSFVCLDLIFVSAKASYFLEGGYIPVIVGGLLFLVMWAWKWGRKATFAAYSNVKTMTLAELIAIKESSSVSLKKNIIFMVQRHITDPSDNIPALIQMYLNRYHYLPENIFIVQVIHRNVPYVHGARHDSQVFYKSGEHGTVVMVRVYFGFMEEPNVEKVLEDLSRHHELSLPKDPHAWLVHVSHEYLIGPKNIGQIERFKLKLFMFLRQISQPAYYHYGLGRDVNLSMDILPVHIPRSRFWSRGSGNSR